MTKPFAGPFGPSMRDVPLLSIIVICMALSACMTAQEKRQIEEKAERLQAAQIERIEQAAKEEEERKAAEKAALEDWKKKNEPYLRRLCEADPGAEHRYAWDNYRIAVSTDAQHAEEARKFRRPVIDCEEYRIQKPSAFNADAFIDSLKAEEAQRDEWLASPEGRAFQRHLCSLSGDEQQKALENALNIWGLISRENVTDEKKARSHGFAVLDCAPDKTSTGEQVTAEVKAVRAAAMKSWLDKWVKDNEQYIRGLCAGPPGKEHQWTWDNFQVAVSTDSQHAGEATKTERPIVDCERFRTDEPTKESALGYIWSNILM